MVGGRWVVDGVVGREDCGELQFLHRSNAVVGYRDRFSVATLCEPLRRSPDTGAWGHLMPLLRLRGTLPRRSDI